MQRRTRWRRRRSTTTTTNAGKGQEIRDFRSRLQEVLQTGGEEKGQNEGERDEREEQQRSRDGGFVQVELLEDHLQSGNGHETKKTTQVGKETPGRRKQCHQIAT